MEDSVLKAIAEKIAERYDEIKNYFYSKSDKEILNEEKRAQTYENSGDVFISDDNILYREINFRRFRVTTVLSYIYNNGNLKNIVGIEENGKIKLYEKFYPHELRRMAMGRRLHEIAEAYASTIAPFTVEENLSAEIDGDIVVGRLDLVHNSNGEYTIIDIKTGRLHEDLAKLQLAVYAYMYAKKHNIPNKINIAVVSPEGIIKDTLTSEDIRRYVQEFIDAKREIKDELSRGKFCVFRKVTA